MIGENSRISSGTNNVGRAGNVDVTASDSIAVDGGRIAADSLAGGTAGKCGGLRAPRNGVGRFYQQFGLGQRRRGHGSGGCSLRGVRQLWPDQQRGDARCHRHGSS